MTIIKKIAKNTIVLLTAQIASLVFGYLFLMYTAQYLGPQDFGILSFALALAGIFGLFSDMGLSQLIVRDVARNYSVAEKYIGNIIFIKLLLSGLTLCVLILLLNYASTDQKFVITLIGLSLIIESFNKMFYSLFQAFEDMEFQAIGQIINCIALLIGALYIIKYNFNIIFFGLLYTLVSIITMVYNLFVVRSKFLVIELKLEYTFWKELLRESIPFAITGISINIFIWVDTLMLSVMKGDEVVGWYNAAYKLVLALRFIPFVLMYSTFPIMAKYYVSSKNYLPIIFEKLFKLMVFIGLPLGVGTLFIADKIILEVYGTEYINSIIVLKILIWSSVLVFIRIPYERLMESINKQALITKLFIIGAIFNIMANILLIPKYSYIGAGFATIITDLLLLVLLIIYSKKVGYSISNKQCIYVAKICFSCIIMALFLEYESNLTLFVKIIGATFFFMLSSFLLKIYDEDEYNMLKSVFHGKKRQ